MLIALSRDSRAEVDAITEAAAAAGGKADILSARIWASCTAALRGPDGHVFEPMWMDMGAATAP